MQVDKTAWLKVFFILALLTGQDTLLSADEPAFQNAAYEKAPMRKIAVVCGQRQQHLADLAELITKQLDILGSVECIPQKEIISRLPVYPSNVLKNIGPGTDSFSGFLSEEDMQSVLDYSQNIKTDFIFLIWMDNIHRGFKDPGEAWTSYDGKTFSTHDPADFNSGYYYEMNLYCRLIDVRSKKVVGFHNIRQHANLKKGYDDPAFLKDWYGKHEKATYKHGFKGEILAFDSLLDALAVMVKDTYKLKNEGSF